MNKYDLEDTFETLCDMFENDCIDSAMRLLNSLTKKQQLKFFKFILKRGY